MLRQGTALVVPEDDSDDQSKDPNTDQTKDQTKDQAKDSDLLQEEREAALQQLDDAARNQPRVNLARRKEARYLLDYNLKMITK
jgi:hypothetical protein